MHASHWIIMIFWDVLQQGSGTPARYLEVKTSDTGVSLVVPANYAMNMLTDDSLTSRSW